MVKVKDFHESVRDEIKKGSEEILKTSVPLYLQALTTFEVLHRLIGHMTMFYSQRRPQELGAIAWVVDGKNPQSVTMWEEWWSHYARGALATMSKRRPSPQFSGGDYSFYDKSYGTTGDDGEEGTDLKELLKDTRFSAKSEAGLEFVDILSNAVRRTLTGNLQKEGWQNIKKVMVHRKDAYIQFVVFGDERDFVQKATYAKTVYEGFSQGGKSMLTPTNDKLVAADIAKQQPKP